MTMFIWVYGISMLVCILFSLLGAISLKNGNMKNVVAGHGEDVVKRGINRIGWMGVIPVVNTIVTIAIIMLMVKVMVRELENLADKEDW